MKQDQGASAKADRAATPSEPSQSSVVSGVAGIPCAEAAAAAFGTDMFDVLFAAFCDGQFEVELFDLIERNAVKAGLVEKTEFDPEQHTSDCDCEPGDDYYIATDAGRAVLAKARGQ